MPAKLAIAAALIACCGAAFGLGEDQLYTGDARTVRPGGLQLQAAYRGAFGEGARVGGASLTVGATPSMDVKLSYGYLWSYSGTNYRIGPSIGAKWRFVGDGQTEPSVALSGLCASRQRSGDPPSKADFGALLIFQQPTPVGTVLVNVGRVFVGENVPDLRYLAAALARRVTPHVLVAAQYIDVDQFGQGVPGREFSMWVGAVVYHPNKSTGYSMQIGYTPEAVQAHWNATLGIGLYF